MADQVIVVNDSQRSAAKVAAWVFPVSMALVVYANFGMRGGMFVKGNLAETVRRVAASELLFRTSIIFDIAYCMGFVVLISALYVVLRPVNQRVALMASVAKLVYLVTALLMVFSYLNILHLASDPKYVDTLGAGTIQGVAGLNSAALWDQYYVGRTFWALSSTLFAWLWLKSGYIPRALALYGIASSAWCMFCALVYLTRPAFSTIVNLWVFDMPMILFYLPLSAWILVKGLRDPAHTRIFEHADR